MCDENGKCEIEMLHDLVEGIDMPTPEATLSMALWATVSAEDEVRTQVLPVVKGLLVAMDEGAQLEIRATLVTGIFQAFLAAILEVDPDRTSVADIKDLAESVVQGMAALE